jgi:hypothetical protein
VEDEEEDVRREALRWALRQVEREVGPILAVLAEIRGTAPGHRLLVQIGRAGRAFVKVADGSEWSADAVGVEAALLSGVRHRHLPRVLACDPTASVPWLVLPDLSGARWPPPWPDEVGGLHKALARLRRIDPPPWLPRAEDVDPWVALLADERDGDAAAWWRPRAHDLAGAARRVRLSGDRLVHGDLGAGNVCISRGRAVLVDWSDAAVGDPSIDHVTLAVDVARTGGPRAVPPVDDPAGWLAKVAGMLLEAARRDPWPGEGGRAVRAEQAALARTAGTWALELLDA